MQGWRAGMVVCGLAVACGGPLPDEGLSPDTSGEEAGASSEPVPGSDEPSPQWWCPPTAGETQRVKTILPPSQFGGRYAAVPESLVEFRGQLFFAVNFEDGRMALWRSTGSEAGTVEVRAFPALPPWSFPRLGELTPARDTLFFLANEAATGSELWVTDGTPGGTRQVVDLTPGPESSSLSHLTGLGQTLVFFRRLPESPSLPERSELWRSDGSAAGTVRLLELAPGTSVGRQEIQLGDSLFFFLSDASHGTELWRTDGTTAGTSRVRALDEDEVAVLDVHTTSGKAFFTLRDEGGLTELWQTDGTPAGTRRMYTFGSSFFLPRILGALGEHLYLALPSLETQRLRLYRMRTDGTPGREYVTTLDNPYAGQPDAVAILGDVSLAEGRIFFSIVVASQGPAPRDTQLWVTDGTPSGTRLLRRPLSLSDEYSSPILAVGAGLAFFSAYEQSSAGIEPWVTDGTVQGTRRLRDIAPGGESSYPRSFTRLGDRIFFSAYDETLAGQLWSAPLRRTCVAGHQ
jgi:ELWxxDGT repeat protein